MAQVETRGPAVQAVAIAFLVLSIVAAVLRCYVRAFIVKAFGVDDHLMILALVSFILNCTCCLNGVYYGTGRHYWDLEEADMQNALKYWYFCYISYCVTMTLSKLSIGYFLLRITVQRLHRWIVYGIMLVTVVTGLVFFFVTMLQCMPLSYFWNKNQAGTCINVEIIIALTYMYSVFSVTCDFTFALFPIVLIMNLQMNLRTKIALVPIMLMACVASSAVVVRFAYVKDFKSPDFLYATVDIAIWSTIEQGLAIAAGSLATLRPLFRKVAVKLGWSVPSSSPTSGDHASASRTRRNGNSRAQHSRGPISLTTFAHRDKEEDEKDLDQGKLKLGDGYLGSYTTTVTTAPTRKSLWGTKGHKSDNGSEEELHTDGTRSDMKAVQIKSFLITEETV
ncbi:hypothetical protein GQ53DRAFT_863589 [Thozetella sp. PMI_491]|nr:hypothetical protein GQ53DRAFT_863589 [Thozetella sp. PMI_491]